MARNLGWFRRTYDDLCRCLLDGDLPYSFPRHPSIFPRIEASLDLLVELRTSWISHWRFTNDDLDARRMVGVYGLGFLWGDWRIRILAFVAVLDLLETINQGLNHVLA